MLKFNGKSIRQNSINREFIVWDFFRSHIRHAKPILKSSWQYAKLYEQVVMTAKYELFLLHSSFDEFCPLLEMYISSRIFNMYNIFFLFSLGLLWSSLYLIKFQFSSMNWEKNNHAIQGNSDILEIRWFLSVTSGICMLCLLLIHNKIVCFKCSISLICFCQKLFQSAVLCVAYWSSFILILVYKSLGNNPSKFVKYSLKSLLLNSKLLHHVNLSFQSSLSEYIWRILQMSYLNF